MTRALTSAAALLAALACATAASGAGGSSSATPPRQFVTGVFDPVVFKSADRDKGFALAKAAGARIVRLLLNWRDVAPEAPSATFDGRNPEEAGYDWAEVDGQIRRARARGFEVILNVYDAPVWASGGYDARNLGPYWPQTPHLRSFAQAAVKRYSGRYRGLPRIRYWQFWNEPNLGLFLMPQRHKGSDVAAAQYRTLLNAFAQVVHAGDASNLVVAGGTAPFSSDREATPPLRFMRQLLCVSAGARPRRTCAGSVEFDVWSHHPYTSGGPNHHANRADDVSLGDLPEMRALLDAAQRLGAIATRKQQVEFWVTEFSWDSSPPDPGGVPDARLARWVAEAFYRMWQSGVSVATWFKILDEPLRTSFHQSGLHRGGGAPKPLQRAFRFPFVALKTDAGVELWGRTPTSRPGIVTVERKVRARWQPVARLRANASGVFFSTETIAAANTDLMRARFGGETSTPFALGPTKDVPVRPFGVLERG